MIPVTFRPKQEDIIKFEKVRSFLLQFSQGATIRWTELDSIAVYLLDPLEKESRSLLPAD